MTHRELLDNVVYPSYLRDRGAENYYEQNAKAMRELIRFVEKHTASWETGGLEVLDKLLDHADVGRMHELGMLALIRCNYRMRGVLMNWRSFTLSAKAELERRGLPTQSLLHGINLEENKQ